MNSQVFEVINTAIAEKVLSSIQNVLGVQRPVLYSKMDHRSGGTDRNPGDHFSRQDQENRSKTNSKFDNQGRLVRESSVDSQDIDQDCDDIRTTLRFCMEEAEVRKQEFFMKTSHAYFKSAPFQS